MELKTEKNEYIQNEKENILLKIFNLFSIKEKPKILNDEKIQERDELLNSLRDAKQEWISSSTNFEYASESDLVDYYSYKMKACQVRYNYLLKQAKEKGIKID